MKINWCRRAATEHLAGGRVAEVQVGGCGEAEGAEEGDRGFRVLVGEVADRLCSV